MAEDETYLPNIRIPMGVNWECSRCDATGDSTEETLVEHYRTEHPAVLGEKE